LPAQLWRFTLAQRGGERNHGASDNYELGAFMNDILPSSFGPAGQTSAHPQGPAGHLPYTSFSRCELNEIFSVYGAKVAEGEWRDYSIDFMRDRAVFSVFRQSAERALYRIEKNPKLSKRQGTYSVVATTGLILKRGHDLSKVLRVLDRKLRAV
jgi:Protein of unknown function (DUF2794)